MIRTRAVLAAALLTGAAVAVSPADAKVPPCPGGRYLVLGEPIVGGSDAALADTVELAGRMVSIASGCQPVKARVRATRRGTKVVARWASCQGMAGTALLKGTITEYCRTLNATFSVRAIKMTKPFIAALSICGDGIWDPTGGEECDGALGPCGALCNACTCVGATTTTTTPGMTTTTGAGATTTTTTGGPATTGGVTTTTTAGTTTTGVTTTTGNPTTTSVTTTTTAAPTSSTSGATTSTSTTAPGGTTSTSSSTSSMPVFTTTTTSTTILAPDLIPIAFACPFSMPAGSQVLMDYTVKNQGQLAATAPWYDYVVFSTDMTLGGDSAIYVYQRVANLAANATYSSQSPTVTMPNVPAGSYYLFFQTDGAGQVAESTHEANNVNGPVLIAITVPDLTPTAFTPPASATAGSQISIPYTVKNQGSTTAAAPWSEQVVISTDATFGGDATLATVPRMVGLAATGTYTSSAMVTLSVPPGTYYLFFQTDAADQVYEGGVEANNVSGPKTIVIN